MKKKILAVLLAATMMMPSAVFAGEITENTEDQETVVWETETVETESEEPETEEGTEPEVTETEEAPENLVASGIRLTEKVVTWENEKNIDLEELEGTDDGPLDLSRARECYRDMKWNEEFKSYIFKDDNGGTTLLDPEDPEFVKNVFGPDEKEANGVGIAPSGTPRTATGNTVASPYTGKTYTFAASKANATINDVIDVSSHQGTVNWAAVKTAGIDCAIIRIGYRGAADGVLHEDKNWRTNIAGAKAAGLKIGAYVFSQAITEAEANSEAALAVTCLSGVAMDLPVFIDYEYYGSSGRLRDAKLSAQAHQTICNAFCNTMKTAGYQFGIYANKNMLSTDMVPTNCIAGTVYWLARYQEVCDYGGTYTFWQYSSTGKVGGVTGNTDCSFWIQDGLTASITASPTEIAIYEDSTGKTTLKGSSNTSDVTYAWSLISAVNRKGNAVSPDKIGSLSSTSGDSVNFVAKKPGKVVIRLTVSKSGKSATSDITIMIRGRLTTDNTSLDNVEFEYNGKERKPKATVTFSEADLTLNTDYKISYKANKRVGTATAIIEGMGYFTGTVTEHFEIIPFNLDTGGSTLNIAKFRDQTYSPDGLKPSTTVKMNKTTVSPVKDYKLLYQKSDGTEVEIIEEAGTYYPVIEAIPNGVFSGRYVATANAFVVNPREITKSNVFISDTMIKEGETTPDVYVAVLTAKLEEGTDYNLTGSTSASLGSNSVVVTGLGNYKGSVTVGYQVVPMERQVIDTRSCEITLSQPTYVWNGKARKPGVSVTCNGTVLRKDASYSVSYANNKSAGTGFVLVKGIGSYTGTACVPFTIDPAPASDVKVKLSEKKYTFAAKICRPKVTVTLGNTTLKKDSDYVLTYEDPNSRDAGTYGITIAFRGSVTGEYTGQYKIKQISLEKLDVSIPDQEWNDGDPVEPGLDQFVCKLGKKYLTEKDTEGFVISKYTNNKKPSTADAPAKAVLVSNGSGNFKDGTQKTVSFQIKK